MSRRPAAPATWRAFVAQGLLALLFVFAQQQATLHWLSHAVDAVGSLAHKAKHAPSDVCDECGGLIAFGAMAVADAQPLALPAAVQVGIDTTPALPLQRAPQLGFRSRAPPVLA